MVRALETTSYVTVPQAAAMLGVSPRTVGRLLEQGTIPSFKPRGHRRIKRADVIAYRDQQAMTVDGREPAVSFDHLAD